MRLGASSRRSVDPVAVNSFDCFHRLAAVIQPRFSIRCSASRGANACIYRFKPSLDVMEQMMENDVNEIADEVTDRDNL